MIIAACVLGALSVAAIVVGGAKGKRSTSADIRACDESYRRVNEAISGPEAIRRADTSEERLVEVRDDASRGEEACGRAGKEKEKMFLGAMRSAIAKRLMETPAPSRPALSSSALDPASCPKGRRLIDPATGSMVTCTGGAAGTTAGSDDYGDLQARCNSVNAAWDRSDGIEPIVTCKGGGPNHQDIEVEVSGAAWTFLGERGKRRAFARSIVDAYRPHWTTFHGWSGADPAEKQVHIMKVSGANITLAALTSAGGLYVE